MKNNLPFMEFKLWNKNSPSQSVEEIETAPQNSPEIFKPFIMIFPSARLIGLNGAVISEKNHLIVESTYEFTQPKSRATPWIQPIEKHSLVNQRVPLGPLKKIKGTVATASFWGDSYFHWMLDVLPRLYLLKQSKIPYDHLYLNPIHLPFQIETLEILGFQVKNILPWKSHTHLLADYVILPSFSSPPGQPSPWVLKWLRSVILKGKPFSSDKRIYLTRANNRYRKIANEKELIQTLNPFGFEIIDTEGLSVTQQAELFASSQVIIALHSASLTNLIFCEKGTEVIEFIPEDWQVPCYLNISHAMGLKHYLMEGKRTPHTKKQLRKDELWVDCKQLEELLQEKLDLAKEKI